MRIRIRWRKLVAWTLLLILCTIAGGLGFAYSFYTDSATLGSLLKAEIPRYFPHTQFDVGRVRVRPFIGEVTLTDLGLRQVVDGANFQMLRIPWLHVRHDARALLKGHFEPQEVVVSYPTLRLCRRRDGSWNLQGFLADPWPAPPLKQAPPVTIQNGSIELAETGPDGSTTVFSILRKASIKIESLREGELKFEGLAEGDAFDRVSLNGTIDLGTGRIYMTGDLARVELTEKLFKRSPPEWRTTLDRIGLTAGELDVDLNTLIYDPSGTPKLRYAVKGRLNGGAWNCNKLPFPINDLAASLILSDGVLKIDKVEGYNGTTRVGGTAEVVLSDSPLPPLKLSLELSGLELNDRLKKWTPPEFAETWENFKPTGVVSVNMDVTRTVPGGPVALGMHVKCHDVAMVYKHFAYPLEHIRGDLDFTPAMVRLNLHTLLGGKPLTAVGTIVNPGPNAIVKLDFKGQSLPIDKLLFDAVPPEIRKVLDDFKPAGSVRGTAHIERHPPLTPRDDPRGRITLVADLDMNEGCSIRWADLPYPVEHLTGRLELRPDQWRFRSMRGDNGQAEITGYGDVKKVPGAPVGKDLKIDLHLQAKNLPFDDELHRSLPEAWQKTWTILNPIGASNIEATVKIAPGRPDDYHVEITPKLATSVRLRFERIRQLADDPGGTVEMRMEDVNGRFIFDNGTVKMHDVGFHFHESPVRVASGTVVVENSGRFNLKVEDLRVDQFRVDSRLRAMMPPLMAQFARRIDNELVTFRGNLGLQWSGKVDDPVRCEWDNGLVVLNNNNVDTGVPLKHLQGQLEMVRGWSNGEALEVHGFLRLDSAYLHGLQVTRVEAPFHVQKGRAWLDGIQGKLLGGDVTGKVAISLEGTPRYEAKLALTDADLQNYTMTIPGKQDFRGIASAQIDFRGQGTDLHTLQGSGEAHVSNGYLGELPGFLRLVKILNLSPATKTAFDSADVAFMIQNGETHLVPIKFTGNAFSLMGGGTLDLQGALDLRLRVLYGRDKLHLFMVSDALREASGQILVIRVQGTPAFPKFFLEVLPKASEIAKSFAERKVRQDAGVDATQARTFRR